jgi:hypothetical protein
LGKKKPHAPGTTWQILRPIQAEPAKILTLFRFQFLKPREILLFGVLFADHEAALVLPVRIELTTSPLPRAGADGLSR